MNVRVILFNGIMAALMGAMLGIAVAYIGQRAGRTKTIVVVGATLGFAIGVTQGIVRQQREAEEEDYKDPGSPET